MQDEKSQLELLSEEIENLSESIKNVISGMELLTKSFGGILETQKKSIKIFKSANTKSIMDVSSSLKYHKVNSKGEAVYKGKVIFSITELDEKTLKVKRINGVEKYIKAFVDKAKAKVLMLAIANQTFKQIYSNGFTDFGGTINADPNKIRSRILKINLTDRGQYVFTIEEGKGKKGETGNIQMIGKPEMTVQRYVPQEEALQMANEVYDYIRDFELVAQMQGNPLYTIGNYEGHKETNLENQITNVETEVSQNEKAQEEVYQITIDPWKGKYMHELQNEELKFILQKTQGIESDIAKKLNDEAVKEVKKRMAKANA